MDPTTVTETSISDIGVILLILEKILVYLYYSFCHMKRSSCTVDLFKGWFGAKVEVEAEPCSPTDQKVPITVQEKSL